MGYNTNRLLRDAEGYPIPQVYDPETDSFKPATKTQDVSDSNVLNELKKINENNGIALQAYDKSSDALGKSEAAEANSVVAIGTANAAKTIAELVREEFDRIIAEAGESNPEVVQARGEEVNLGVRLNKINDQLKESEQQTTTLKHGLNIINSDQASPLKVEFYGNTLVNLLGKDGGFETDSNGDGVADGWILSAGQANNISVVTNKQRLTFNGTHLWHSIKKTVKLESGLYYLAVVDSTFSTTGDDTRGLSIIVSKKSDNSTVSFNTKGSSKLSILKFTVPSSGDYDISLQTSTAFAASGYVDMNNARLYPISKNSYDKIGVALTDSDVERMFPYVDSVQHVKNPVVKVEGDNLIPPFIEWTLDATAERVNNYEIKYGAVSTYKISKCTVKVAPNTNYSINVTHDGNIGVYGVDSGAYIVNLTASQTITFNSGNNRNIEVSVRNKLNAITAFNQPILNLGTQPKPFTPKNDSYLYAETTLAGNADKKDILSFNESVGRWEKTKWWMADVVLDGSLSWGFHADHVGYKRLKITIENTANDSADIIKFNGAIINHLNNGATFTSGDQEILSSNLLFITVSDTDSGWTDAMTPSADLIKAYFNGWKYTGDGTNHSWVSLIDGSAPSSNTLAYVSANKVPNFTPYKLTYQLENPVIEPVTVEGDLSIQGNAQAEVSSGVIVREKANPVYHVVNKQYYINDLTYGTSASLLKYKNLTIIGVYKNNELDNKWTIANGGGNGNYRLAISESNFDPTAEYTVTYEILDKHAMTTNLNEVKATYQNSLKSSFTQVVVKQGDIATEQTIQARQIYNMLVRLKALEG